MRTRPEVDRQRSCILVPVNSEPRRVHEHVFVAAPVLSLQNTRLRWLLHVTESLWRLETLLAAKNAALVHVVFNCCCCFVLLLCNYFVRGRPRRRATKVPPPRKFCVVGDKKKFPRPKRVGYTFWTSHVLD